MKRTYRQLLCLLLEKDLLIITAEAAQAALERNIEEYNTVMAMSVDILQAQVWLLELPDEVCLHVESETDVNMPHDERANLIRELGAKINSLLPETK